MAGQVLELLQDINQAGTTIVMVTHDPSLASKASRIIALLDGKVESGAATQLAANAQDSQDACILSD
jgi:putative ABC transport system ATP-binding protein